MPISKTCITNTPSVTVLKTNFCSIFFLLLNASENEQRWSERLREVEREKEEEAKRQQELIDRQREEHLRMIEELKLSEERLKTELKLTQNENKRRRRLPSE